VHKVRVVSDFVHGPAGLGGRDWLVGAQRQEIAPTADRIRRREWVAGTHRQRGSAGHEEV
jgi:hypothetical protein